MWKDMIIDYQNQLIGSHYTPPPPPPPKKKKKDINKNKEIPNFGNQSAKIHIGNIKWY